MAASEPPTELPQNLWRNQMHLYTGEIFAISAPETFLCLERNLHLYEYTCSILLLKKLMLLKGIFYVVNIQEQKTNE